MESGYGNLGWEVFVYSTYIIVGLSLFIYAFISISSRKKSIKNMLEEGFFTPSTQTSNENAKENKNEI